MTNANIYTLLHRAWTDPAAIALYDCPDVAGAEVTYGALDAAVARAAAALAERGLVPGDRLAMALPKSTATFVLFLAALRSGLTLVPCNPASPAQGVAAMLERTDPALVLVDAEAPAGPIALAARTAGARVDTVAAGAGLDPLPSGSATDAAPDPLSLDGGAGVDPLPSDKAPNAGRDALSPHDGADVTPAVLTGDHPAIILFTSGSTGAPKGVPITHGALAGQARALCDAWQITAADRLLHVLPMTHAHGLIISLLPLLLAGGAICLRGRFEPGDVVARLPRASCFMGVPFTYAQLMDHPGFDAPACATIRLFVSGSAPLPDDLRQGFEARTGHPLLERYGMTETLISTANGPASHRGGSVGRPLPGVDLRIRPLGAPDGPDAAPGEEGEVELRGPSVLSGYLAAPDQTAGAFAPDGFFRTGDLGRLDADGFLSITGRAKDLIVYAGLKVHPAEVEAALRELDEIGDACVFGVPHPSAGEAVMAAVVLRPGAGATSPAALRGQLIGRLPPSHVPRRIHVLADLPRNAMGKLQRNVLRDWHADGRLAAGGDGGAGAETGAQPGLCADTKR